MHLYRPAPTPPGEPNNCLGCGTEIDGDTVTGFWLERENWKEPNTYELHCLSCCVAKMNAWPNQPNVASEADVRAQLS